MPLPKPKLLPQVKYEPVGGEAGAGGKGTQPQATYNPMNYYNPMQDVQPPVQEVGQGQYAAPYTPPAEVMGPPSPTQADWNAVANTPPPTPPQGKPGVGEVMGPPSPTAQDWNAVAAKNRTNYQQAASAGDTANMARLDAEWKRIAPLAQQYGISAQRLVNSYMQPSNPAAKSDFNSALAAAISDDVWAKEATNAFGRPPNQLEWDEHWAAMNVGGRDPLTGHPQAIQNIQNAMNNIGQQNQQQASDQYQQWLATQQP